MKKGLSLLLAMLLALFLVSCSGKDVGNEGDVADGVGMEDVQKSDESHDSKEALKGDILWETDDCKIILTQIQTDAWNWQYGDFYGVDLSLQNTSADTEYQVTVTNPCIDGVAVRGHYNGTVLAGETVSETIALRDELLVESGATDYTDIELTFTIRPVGDPDHSVSETVHIYPLGEDKAKTFVREAQPTDTVLVDNDAVTVVVTECSAKYDEENDFESYDVDFYIVNKTDVNIVTSEDEASINGVLCDPTFANEVPVGKVGLFTMSWSKYALEDAGIPEPDVKEIKFLLKVKDDHVLGWGESFVEQEVTLNP